MAQPAAALPAFEEGSQCAVCSCSFGTFKRRHHCRACGRSLCNEHSSNQKAFPHFGLHAPVRVCNDCFHDVKPSAPSSTGTEKRDEVIDNADNQKVSSELRRQEDDAHPLLSGEHQCAASSSSVLECRCGMPLCICTPADSTPAKEAPLPQAEAVRHRRTVRAAPAASRQTLSTSGSSLPSLFFSTSNPSYSGTYDASEEGLREAVKNGDVETVRLLLGKRINPNYSDKQGMSLLHLAAVFNFTDIAFMLVDAGADLQAKNGQGETPVDCAPTTLQNKLREKLQQQTSR